MRETKIEIVEMIAEVINGNSEIPENLKGLEKANKTALETILKGLLPEWNHEKRDAS